MEIINWGIVKHPMNWVTLILMILIAGIFVSLVLKYFGKSPKAQPQS